MSQLKKILVAYDGSPHSKEALNWAIELSIQSGAQVTAVKVFDASTIYPLAEIGGTGFIQALDGMRQEDEQLMEEVATVGKNKGVKITGEILQGNIAGAILEYAKEGKFDLIIAGTKGHGALEELLMGSVTRNLVSLAHIPVMVVKD